ncbi:MAG TPA: VWA domain-containing protein [Xanthobacteraceae bacterium]|nr:VWA domain-containing protein [Xanthobacteraceae bacterium]
MNGSDITLLRPLWLLAPPLILLLAYRLRAHDGLGDWRRAVDPHLLAALARQGAVVAAAGRRRLSPWLLAAALIGAALAGPALERADAQAYRNLDGLILALDTSPSVARGGAAAQARLAALQVAQAAGSRQVALVVYAGDAYLAAAFTADAEALRPLVAADPAGLVPDAGSAPARAVALAHTLFERAGMIGGDLVMVTDGGGIDEAARTQAGRLAGQDRRLHVLFVPIEAPGGPAPDEAAARALAAAGGGSFATVDDPAPVAQAIARSPAQRLGASAFAALAWTDFGRAALAFAGLPLLLAFRRRS